MHTFIALSFTLKGGQSFPQLKPSIQAIQQELVEKGEDAILVHGFMTRAAIVEKGFSPEIVDTLGELFPTQINCYYDGKPDRKKMAALLHEFGGEVHVIGQVIEGVAEEVAEEVAEYEAAGVNIVYHEIV